MFLLFRTLLYATVFVGLLFLYLPARLLEWSGIGGPSPMVAVQAAGLVLGTMGAVLVLACVGVFIGIGKGTPAPFDPPRRLVVRGPYRFVRNPMYIGAVLTLAGAALYYASVPLLVYSLMLLAITHLMVVYYEEPTLRRSFGREYEAYCRRVCRWCPAPHALGTPRA